MEEERKAELPAHPRKYFLVKGSVFFYMDSSNRVKPGQ